MRPGDLLHWNKAEPFVPYRIRLTSGRTFDVPHPEMLLIGRTSATYVTFIGEGSDVYEKLQMIGLLLIETIEPIASPAAA